MNPRISRQKYRSALPLGSGRQSAERAASERNTKQRLAVAINKIVGQMHLQQSEAAQRLGINQPKISALAHLRLDGFSVERLMNFLNSLGRDVEIVIRPTPISRRNGKTLIRAAQ